MKKFLKMSETNKILRMEIFMVRVMTTVRILTMIYFARRMLIKENDILRMLELVRLKFLLKLGK